MFGSNRSSSWATTPRCPSPPQHPEVLRERSITDRKPYTQLDEQTYRAEASLRYPPDGYSVLPKKRVRVGSQRKMIGGGDNRDWAPDIQNSRNKFKADQDAYKQYHPQYQATIQTLKISEAERGVTAM
ncbi:hypothetical protein GLAREA_01350 [Glarea lozoyensis ATCC 20868]|uniref:Uncharacterized protein n=1 Tax=Glarea lozoyensis (strain ATCC 20868 / MF5171) TaxID=1116229 RepID=S3DFM0_GLAL2|nr:uncharacterized protein GLAREA_01350 [Glarea lozoyensis ATCC 20868]EPE25438.1 hypothetical protein GLAREA_01350 [Glarea lozoyensis ATCC 20868]